MAAALPLGACAEEASDNASGPASRGGELKRLLIDRLLTADIARLGRRCGAGCVIPTAWERLRGCGLLDAASASARRSTVEGAARGGSLRGSLVGGSLEGLSRAGSDLRPARPSQMYQSGRGNICRSGSGKPLSANAIQNWSI
jgi:hypothetical protein